MTHFVILLKSFCHFTSVILSFSFLKGTFSDGLCCLFSSDGIAGMQDNHVGLARICTDDPCWMKKWSNFSLTVEPLEFAIIFCRSIQDHFLIFTCHRLMTSLLELWGLNWWCEIWDIYLDENEVFQEAHAFNTLAWDVIIVVSNSLYTNLLHRYIKNNSTYITLYNTYYYIR